MGVYISFFIILLIMFLYDIGLNSYFKKKSNFFKYVAIIVAFIFIAFRFDNGWDYMAYYNTIKYGMHTNIIDRGEYLTIFLIEIARKFNFPLFYFFVNSLIQLFCISYMLIKYSKDFWFGFFLYISFPLFYLNSFSVIRMFTAVSIVFISFSFLYEKKYLKFVLCIIIAALFHKSAIFGIIFLFLPLINKVKINNMWYLVLIPIIRVVAYNVTKLRFPEYMVYFEENPNQEGTKAIFVFLVIFMCLIIFNGKIKNNPLFSFQSKIFSIGIIVYLTFLGMGTLSHRLSLFGTIMSVLIIEHLVTLFPKKYRNLITLTYFAICFVMYVYTVKIGEGTFIPYKSILFIE